MVRRLQVHQRCAAKTEESLMAVHATKSAKTRGKKWWPCWILSERAKEGSRKSIWYAEMDWSLKWYTFHRKSHRGINRLSSQQKESCPAMAGSCGSFVFPGRGAFPIPGAEFWVIFIHMFWDIQFSLLIYWYDWSQAESCVSLCWLCLHMTIV